MEKTELTNAQKQNRVRQRITQASIDPDKYEYIPAKEQNDHVKADQYQRVAIYARVSTDNPMQTTSFELQQKYYEELVAQHPRHWAFELSSGFWAVGLRKAKNEFLVSEWHFLAISIEKCYTIVGKLFWRSIRFSNAH